MWRASDGVLCRTLQGHGHWVNVLALNTDYAMRTGAFDPAKFTGDTERRNSAGASGAEKRARAKRRYESVVQSAQTELMVSGSDDHTLFLWRHTQEKKPIARMTGKCCTSTLTALSFLTATVSVTAFSFCVQVTSSW